MDPSILRRWRALRPTPELRRRAERFLQDLNAEIQASTSARPLAPCADPIVQTWKLSSRLKPDDPLLEFTRRAVNELVLALQH
jgi:hypothetical protein